MLAASQDNQQSFQQWWQTNGNTWRKQLSSIMIQYRKIGHGWTFSSAQRELLWLYYHANQLLMTCLASECYVSREVRHKIESELLLPIGKLDE